MCVYLSSAGFLALYFPVSGQSLYPTSSVNVSRSSLPWGYDAWPCNICSIQHPAPPSFLVLNFLNIPPGERKKPRLKCRQACHNLITACPTFSSMPKDKPHTIFDSLYYLFLMCGPPCFHVFFCRRGRTTIPQALPIGKDSLTFSCYSVLKGCGEIRRMVRRKRAMWRRKINRHAESR